MPKAHNVVLLEGARTPFGTFLGGLSPLTATQLGVHAARAALQRAGVPAGEVDSVCFGNVIQSAADTVYLPRHVGLEVGVPEHAPALGVNRACGSGLEAVIHGARAIMVGEARCVLTGGAENMSEVPHALRGARRKARFGQPPPLEDVLASALYDAKAGCTIGQTVEHLALAHDVTRAAADAAAVEGQRRAAAAQAAGVFAEQIVPVQTPGRRGRLVDTDEAPRPDTTLEALARLPGLFGKGGVITAGNSCGLNDGAAALLTTSGEFAQAHGLAPLGRLVSWRVVGVPPREMGLGPIAASQGALADAGLTVADLDVVELNDSFTVQAIAAERALGLDPAKTNPNGGAIALGHPMGATGARVLLAVLHHLRRTGGRFGLCTVCIGGGQGVAAVVERLS